MNGTHTDAAAGAKKLITFGLGLSVGQELLVIADEQTWEVAHLLVDEAGRRGVAAGVFVVPLAEQARHGVAKSLPVPLVQAINASSHLCTVLDGGQGTLAFRTLLIEQSCHADRAIAHLPGATPATLAAVNTDDRAVDQRNQALARGLILGRDLTLTTGGATGREYRLALDLGGWSQAPAMRSKTRVRTIGIVRYAHSTVSTMGASWSGTAPTTGCGCRSCGRYWKRNTRRSANCPIWFNRWGSRCRRPSRGGGPCERWCGRHRARSHDRGPVLRPTAEGPVSGPAALGLPDPGRSAARRQARAAGGPHRDLAGRGGLGARSRSPRTRGPRPVPARPRRGLSRRTVTGAGSGRCGRGAGRSLPERIGRGLSLVASAGAGPRGAAVGAARPDRRGGRAPA